MNKVREVTEKHFATSGSCFAPIKIIYGKVENQMFVSPEFTAPRDGREFWDKLREYAHSINRLVVLMEK